MKHDFQIMSVKTANKSDQKYLGKDGTQAYRVSTKIGDDWHACMIYDEALLPVKGKEYNIELSENEGYKNWDFKLLTKKEQIQGNNAQPAPQTAAPQVAQPAPQAPPPTQEHVTEEKPDWDEINKGKVRHGVSIAFIEKGEKLHFNKERINDWTNFIMTGK